jgi:hypothetical protein
VAGDALQNVAANPEAGALKDKVTALEVDCRSMDEKPCVCPEDFDVLDPLWPGSVAIHSQRILNSLCLPSLVDNRPKISVNDLLIKLLIFMF